MPEIEGATVATSVADLERVLTREHILVWRHGSTFPNDAWPVLRRHLERGGSLLYIGGEPFGVPVAGPAGQRIVLAPNIAMRKFLRLNQCHLLDAAGARLAPRGPWLNQFCPRPLPEDSRVAILEPRLCDTKDFPHEDGSPGARDGIIRPLAHLHRAADDPRFPFAAAAIAIDRLRGSFAGGRWVFWLVSTPPNSTELQALLIEAAREPCDLRVDPTFGCFHEGEQPSVMLRCHRPRAASPWTAPVRVRVVGPDGGSQTLDDVALSGGQHASRRVAIPTAVKPGLYRVFAESDELGGASTGFWIFDPALFASGDELTFDSYTMRRNGRPEPVVGTTVMSQTVHRDFLFEPNAAVWDDTFAELAALRINLVRTGVWSGFRKISLEPGAVDEAWLRALEAYYLTARKHGIPVLFTFFAFLPDSFGGENPYFDPRAREGQRAYLAAVAARFAPTREMLWDLINEPSFSAPRHLWKCRPNGDAFEEQAFRAWLAQRFSASTTAENAALTWEEIVQQRWRLLPDEPITLPREEDFAERHVFESARPYRAADYLLFAQEAFTDWALDMRAAIRAAGSTAAITVGQDEGGLTQRPNPLFHHPAVEFTSMHTWWNNDALLWDGLAARAPNKPLLISETGVMNRELLSGEALRTPDDAAKLLSRKIGYAFAAGAFGVVQWCYDVNPYMASDNEVAIGLRRVDGSYKPEHRVLREFAAFVERNRAHFDAPAKPGIAIIVPRDVLTQRDAATAGVQSAVDALAMQLGCGVRLVPDARCAADLGEPRVIVLPSCRGVSDAAWTAILTAGERGARIVCDGWFECNEVGLPARRLGFAARPIGRMEPYEIGDAGEFSMLRYPGAIGESYFAALGEPRINPMQIGNAWISHHRLPLAFAHNAAAELPATYAPLLTGLDVTPSRLGNAVPIPTGSVIQDVRFAECVLRIAINESSVDQPAPAPHGGKVRAGECCMYMLDASGQRILDSSHGEQR
jgi:hypothetical protein